ncbi:basic proline-rich protein-like [Phalacrocorax carbo]|uniref:basic proline-rich protein-like n=1 Tax=Phalacrocorax carbo TaxID=9209 RepID=UPI00311A11E2
MAGPGVLLALGVLLARARGGSGGAPPPPGDFEVEAGVLLAEEPLDPKCFSRRLHDLTCFWESDAPPEPGAFRLQYRFDAAGPPRERVSGAGGGAGAALRALAAPPQPLPGVQPGLRAGPAGAGAAPPHDMDPVTLGLSCLLALLLLGLGLLGLLGHRRLLQEKLWPPVPGPEREFEGLFSAYGGISRWGGRGEPGGLGARGLWLCQGVGAPWAPPGGAPEAEELPSAVEEVGPPLGKGPPTEGSHPTATPPPGPSPASSFDPPPRGPYANLAPHKGPPPDGTSSDGDPLALGPPTPAPPTPAPPYVLCS